jgi:flagellar basal-body rod modification protein FlgD
MSTIDAIKQLTESYNAQATRDEKTKSDLDKDAFLQLLVTQMRYQDPLNPTNDKEFLAQMAQFSALEQMQNLNANFTLQQSFNLIGKEILASTVNPNTSAVEEVQGIVEAVQMYSGKAYLKVGDNLVALESVQEVKNPSSIPVEESEDNEDIVDDTDNTDTVDDTDTD